MLNAEDLPLIIAGERRRIEHDGVKHPALLGKSPKPVERVPFAKIMGRAIKQIMGKIAFSPVEIGLGQVEGGGLGTGAGGGDGKCAGVGKRVE